MTADQKIAVGVACVLGMVGVLAGALALQVVAFALGVALTFDICLGLTVTLRGRVKGS